MADDLRSARRKVEHLQGKLDAAEQRIRELEGDVRRLAHTVEQQRIATAQGRKRRRALTDCIRDRTAYIELLETRLNGKAVSFADESGETLRMNTVPKAWLEGLREENRMLRDRIRALGG